VDQHRAGRQGRMNLRTTGWRPAVVVGCYLAPGGRAQRPLPRIAVADRSVDDGCLSRRNEGVALAEAPHAQAA
jgi:hypothetical protein